MNWKKPGSSFYRLLCKYCQSKFTFDATDKLSFYARGGYYDNKTRRPYEAYDYNILHETLIMVLVPNT